MLIAQRIVHDPIDLRVRPTALQPREHRQRLDDIAQRARFDDENFQSFTCSGGLEPSPNFDGITE